MWLIAVALLFVFGWFTPWWMLVVVALLAGFCCDRLRQAAGAGFGVAVLVWGILIIFFEFQARGLVSHRLSGLFGMSNQYLFIFLILLGVGFIGAISGLLGQWMRRLMSVPM